MLVYQISYQSPHEHFINIECRVSQIAEDKTLLRLPAWRPGRYELQNYAKNIQLFDVFDKANNPLPFKKINKNCWEVETKGITEIVVKYNYYAFQMDAGGSYLDDSQLYLNLINCLIYTDNQIDNACEIHLQLPSNYEIACGLPKIQKHSFKAENYHQLVDSPLIASTNLKHRNYEVSGVQFHIWIKGDWLPDWEIMLIDFEKFTRFQIGVMGEFPEKEYHFLCQILPYKAYHGVEHRNSTVICFGAAETMNEENNYQEFLSICSHELFHAWNICKIRPAEMMPYDYSKEIYFETGFVVEGITTYYGELALARSGVWKSQQFIAEMNKVFKKHFENFGRFNSSLIESSIDLWVDGYTSTGSAPSRKVSIYQKGSIVSMILDLEIRVRTQNKRSLDDVLRLLWQEYGKTQKGYTLQDYVRICEQVAGGSLKQYFDDCIFGKRPLEQVLEPLVENFALRLIINHYNTGSEMFGFQTTQKDGVAVVNLIEPNSNAAKVLSLQDEIIAVNDRKVDNNLNVLIADKQTVILTIFRQRMLYHVVLTVNKESYLKEYTLQIQQNSENSKKENLVSWLG
ncbi:MAG: M61 family peptidase [Raineya sp.]|jgi:predicted metalloprotease with PDZ domain|nr:M61 family peptidase [Raineya sp.]